jgi:exopolysaccharide biosynthesis polyprenyl glycosylphosphotransferase
MKKSIGITLVLVLVDFLSAALSWAAFYYFRKVYVEKMPLEFSQQFYYGIILIPTFWVILYTLFGTYFDVLRHYLMKVLSMTFKSVFLGTIIIFFVAILDDEIADYNSYYTLIGAVFFIHLITTLVPRLMLTYYIVSKVHRRTIGFNTLLIGGSSKAVDIYHEIQHLPKGIGNKFVGFVNLNGIDKELEEHLPYLGHAKELDEVLKSNEIEEVIIALDRSEHEKLKQLISVVQGRDIRIKIIPDMFDILSGSVKMNNIFGALLVEVESHIMPFWQFIVKRLLDIFASAIAMILLIPVYITLAILVKTSSKGPIFFKQERIGKNGVPFHIIKFRTMVEDAEKSGPQLSSSDDPRITKIGRTMRKMRFDELPQFWNVLKGEMSLVGPRPERQFFIDQIAAREPQFLQLNKVKPGITSWGQVKFGYAENVEEMLQRMKYDLLYLKNMSIALDLKILLYTVIIVFKGTGK